MDLDNLLRMLDSERFSSVIDRQCSKKIFSQIESYLLKFYGKTKPENKEKELITFLTPLVGMLRVSQEKKEEYFEKYNNFAKKYKMPEINSFL